MIEGNPHELQKEYLLGMHTGDVVCMRYGESWARTDPDRHGHCPAK